MAGLSGMGTSAVAIIVGAIMRFAISVQTTGFNVNRVGIILMIAGSIGFVIALVLFASTRRAVVGGEHTIHSESVDADGRRVVHDTVER